MNTKADSEYYFRPERCRFRRLGVFFSDDAAKAAAADLFAGKVGRLSVRIGDFAFPVADYGGGSFGKIRIRKTKKGKEQ